MGVRYSILLPWREVETAVCFDANSFFNTSVKSKFLFQSSLVLHETFLKIIGFNECYADEKKKRMFRQKYLFSFFPYAKNSNMRMKVRGNFYAKNLYNLVLE